MDSATLAYVYLSFLTAALLKGVTGLGFSTLCLPLLAVLLDPKVGISLVLVPSLSSNVLVMLRAGNIGEACKRFWPVYLAAIPGLFLGVRMLASLDSGGSRMFLGAVLILYALWALRARPGSISHRAERCLSGPVGVCTGLVNGFTGSQIMPLLPYMLALNMGKDVFVTGINLSFTISSVCMLGLLGGQGMLSSSIVGVSAMGVVFVAVGIWLGGVIRSRLHEVRYRQAVLCFLLVAGGALVLK